MRNPINLAEHAGVCVFRFARATIASDASRFSPLQVHYRRIRPCGVASAPPIQKNQPLSVGFFFARARQHWRGFRVLCECHQRHINPVFAGSPPLSALCSLFMRMSHSHDPSHSCGFQAASMGSKVLGGGDRLLSAKGRHSMIPKCSHPNDCCASEPAGGKIHTTQPQQQFAGIAE
jgi:hypothetical protein